MKTCRVCGLEKPLEAMVKDAKAKDGRKRICKVCDAARMRQYFKDNPEKYEANKEMARKARPQWYRHGLTEEVYNELLSNYDGKCHACKVELATNIDHDHNHCPGMYGCMKCVRGLLCQGCNLALGIPKEDLDKIQGLMIYLSNIVE